MLLRSFHREYLTRHGTFPDDFVKYQAGQTKEPDWKEVDASAWAMASDEARCLELGSEAAAAAIDEAIGKLRRKFNDTILIGGPPCQAYSLVGRARSRGKTNYFPEDARKKVEEWRSE